MIKLLSVLHIMAKQNKYQTLNLAKYLDPRLEDKIIALPLQFEYLPVEIISKQFTKLNSNHPFRIHYLGPRFTNTLVLHKKYSSAANQKQKFYFQDLFDYNRYEVQMRKIVQSNYLNEKLQNNHYYKSSIFYRAFEGMNPTLVLKDQFIFNSCFEAGNLDCVIKVNCNEYDLFLRIDSNTRGHTQWFYFSVQNGKKLGKVTFNLCNLTKPKTLYQQGMRPYVFSRKRFEETGKYWQQDGENVELTQKRLRYNIIYEMLQPNIVYKLSFDYSFTKQDDEVFFAYSIPYTYSQLLKDIQSLPQNIVKKYTLGRSLSGVDIPVLHISNHQQTKSPKKNILIIGRTHPGQSNGSHVLNGFINIICSSNEDMVSLRNKINFIIVPMSNPDGVIMGNSRSSASGKDLNRQYLTSKKQLYPQVFLIKNLAFKLQKNEGIFMFFDFHGHSRKKNTFFYGPVYNLSQPDYYKSRALAKIIQKTNNNFRYYSCSFFISEEKKGTARAVMFQRFKIPFVFTVQSSIGLYYDSNKMKTIDFTKQQWEKIGSDICLGLNQFIVAYQEYQEVIAQRRKERLKRKQKMQKMNKKGKDKKFLQDINYDEQQGLTLINTHKKGGLMFDMMQQIRQMPPQKAGDPQASSDDHDDAEDLESSKLRQFNNLIIQSKQKDQQQRLNKVCQEAEQSIIQKKLQTQNDQIQIMKQVTQEKKNKNLKLTKLNNTLISHSFNSQQPKPFINTVGLKRFTSLHRNVTLHMKNSEKMKPNTTSKDNFRPLRKSVNFQTHRHLISKQFFPVDRCEIVDFPKSSVAMRKDIKKGRVMMDQYLKEKRMERLLNGQRQEQKNQNRTDVLRKISQKPQSLSQSVKKIKVEELINNRTFSQNKGDKRLLTIKGNHATNRIFDSVVFCGFQGMQIDNMAMMIKTFNK